MRVTSLLVTLVCIFSISPHCRANAPDIPCLHHLSGSSSLDSGCYEQAAAAWQKDNEQIARTLQHAIPRGNPNAARLAAYLRAADADLRFCEIDREAGSDWAPSRTAPHLKNMWDVVYAQCVYQRRKEQNAHLRDILRLQQMNDPTP